MELQRVELSSDAFFSLADALSRYAHNLQVLVLAGLRARMISQPPLPHHED
jgi:hypothetical protein